MSKVYNDVWIHEILTLSCANVLLGSYSDRKKVDVLEARKTKCFVCTYIFRIGDLNHVCAADAIFFSGGSSSTDMHRNSCEQRTIFQN